MENKLTCITTVCNFDLTDYIIVVDAHICEVGRERDQHNEWKWVLPYPNPCECTSVIMGGLNTWTPIRPFIPVYVKSPLFSDDVNEIREHYGLACDANGKSCYIYWGSKTHNACKRHGFLHTGFKQTGSSPFSPRYSNGIKEK